MVARQVYVISLQNLACEAFKGTLMTSAEQRIHVFQVDVRVATDLGGAHLRGGPAGQGHACVLRAQACHSCFSGFTSLGDVCCKVLQYAVVHPQILTYSIIFGPMKFG